MFGKGFFHLYFYVYIYLYFVGDRSTTVQQATHMLMFAGSSPTSINCREELM